MQSGGFPPFAPERAQEGASLILAPSLRTSEKKRWDTPPDCARTHHKMDG